MLSKILKPFKQFAAWVVRRYLSLRKGFRVEDVENINRTLIKYALPRLKYLRDLKKGDDLYKILDDVIKGLTILSLKKTDYSPEEIKEVRRALKKLLCLIDKLVI